ncbi:efflux RND transporter periplasmic adaptor subunit [Ancylomarina sp. YFZ004]
MLKKKSIILGVLVAISLFVMAFVLAGMKEPPREKEAVVKTLQIPVLKIKNESLELKHSVIGTLQAHEKVEVYAEVSGILERMDKSFLEGLNFNKGEILLQINDTKMRTGLYAKKSGLMTAIAGLLPDLKFDYTESYESWKTYLSEFDIEKPIAQIPQAINDQEKYFLAGKNIYQSYYDIKSEEEQLTKYTIIAPYKGQVSESNIKAGTVVRIGQKLGEFVNTDTYDLLVGIDLNSLSQIKVGNQAKLYSENISGDWTGRVSRIGNKMDSQTQMVNVYISVSGDDLKEGMFLSADIVLKRKVNGIEIPRKLLIDESFVYLLEKGTVLKKKIDIAQYKDDTVIVSGMEDGSLLVLKTSGMHKGIKGNAVL